MSFKKRDVRKPGRIHAFVATPAYDGRVLTDYAVSLAESVQAATIRGIQVTATVIGNGAFIDLARNTFVRLFLETQCTHLFFIDADLKWEPRAFIGLLEANLPVCAGVYPKRQDPEEYPVRFKEEGEDTGVWTRDGWVMCDRVATGFLCIERGVIEQMVARAPVLKSTREPDLPRLFYTYVDETDRFVGEDFAWCKDYVVQFGCPIPVWPDFNFTHGVQWRGNWHQFLMKASEEERAVDAAAPKTPWQINRERKDEEWKSMCEKQRIEATASETSKAA